ncbi:MAG: complex I NDUFA9 subunit family protein [Zoogloeaceae bacterium]|nr:complex I NDUFA9 subunit family protein [Zoogloeaceae bacterium]
MDTRRILITGGSGFIGSAIVRRLVGPGTQIVLPTREAARAAHLADLPGVEVVTADIHDAATLARLAEGTQAAINLVGVLHSKPGTPWGPEFELAHVALPRSLAAACHRAGTARLIHISALGADSRGPSEYQRSKAAGEQAIHEGGTPPAWTILRPSVVFGPGDSFLNLFAQLVRFIPVLPLAGARTRFQPVFVGDVAEVVARCLEDGSTVGQTFELAGPKTYTLAELVHYVCRVTGRRRLVVPLPEPLAMLQALAMEMLPRPPISRDNVRSLRRDNITAGPPLPFGMAPTPLEDIAPGYLAGVRH